MIFTSFTFLNFILVVFPVYWLLPGKMARNTFLLCASYLFYGFVHPWFCLLIAGSTLVDYLCGLGMQRYLTRRRLFLAISLVCNLGMLGVFKYCNFFIDNVGALLDTIGLNGNRTTLKIFLPVGISFYTFQTLSYTIDIYRGKLDPRKNFVDFALFVAFFPQLVAGPIERAACLLPQFEKRRTFCADQFLSSIPLLIRGYLKKLVIADNVAVFADQIFALQSPGLPLLLAGTISFAIQIYADFSAYTDIARGTARLFGFELMENFRSPYLAVSPSDFWRRWHISFSTWIRDYLYIPLGGSRVAGKLKHALVLITTMGLSGLWHGASWNFVVWGIFHGCLLIVYRLLGMDGKWRPQSRIASFTAWLAMFFLTLSGWAIFRTPSLAWLGNGLVSGWGNIRSADYFSVVIYVLTATFLYSLPLLVLLLLDRMFAKERSLHGLFYGLALAIILVFHCEQGQEFIYFQF